MVGAGCRSSADCDPFAFPAPTQASMLMDRSAVAAAMRQRSCNKLLAWGLLELNLQACPSFVTLHGGSGHRLHRPNAWLLGKPGAPVGVTSPPRFCPAPTAGSVGDVRGPCAAAAGQTRSCCAGGRNSFVPLSAKRLSATGDAVVQVSLGPSTYLLCLADGGARPGWPAHAATQLGDFVVASSAPPIAA